MVFRVGSIPTCGTNKQTILLTTKKQTIMKKLFIAAVLFFAALSGVNAQDNNKSNNNVTREGKTFIAQGAKTKGENAKTEYSYTDTDGKTYEIYLSKNGRAYIKRVSAKTGNTYNKYLPEEVSRQICKEIGREYVETKK